MQRIMSTIRSRRVYTAAKHKRTPLPEIQTNVSVGLPLQTEFIFSDRTATQIQWLVH